MRKSSSPVENVVPIFDPESLPSGWEMVTIGDVCNKVNKINPKDDPDAEFDYIDISAIDNEHFRIAETKRCTGVNAPSRARQLVHSGDVVFSTVRTYLKNFALVTPELDGQVASTGFCVLRSAKPELNKYLFYYVQFDSFLNELSKFQRGTSYPAVRDGDVFAQFIPFPPSGQAERIVAEIEKQFSRLDEAVANLKRVKANLKRYKAAVLKAAVEGKLTEEWRKLHPDVEPADKLLERILVERRVNWQGRGKYREPVGVDTDGLPELPVGWVWTSTDQLVAHITDGDHQAPPQTERGVPFLVIGNVRSGKIDFSDTRFVGETYYNSLDPKRQPKQGDLLYTLVGSYGIPVPVKTDKLFCIQRHMAIFRPHANSPMIYLEIAMESNNVFKQATAVATGTAQMTVPLAGLRKFSIPLPPLTEQQQIHNEVERRLSIIAGAESQVDDNLSRADSLRQSILKQAFSGQMIKVL